MKILTLTLTLMALVGIAAPNVSAGSSDYLPASDKSAPDNSARNVRDRDSHNMLPTDQSNKPEDVDLTRRVRQALESDNNLSIDAKNIKIISSDGVVWLRGPVKDAHEKVTIVRAAREIAGARNVHNELEIANQPKND